MKIVTYYLFCVCLEQASCHTMAFDAYARITNLNTAVSIDRERNAMGGSKSISSLSFFLQLGCISVMHAHAYKRKQTTSTAMLSLGLGVRHTTRTFSFFFFRNSFLYSNSFCMLCLLYYFFVFIIIFFSFLSSSFPSFTRFYLMASWKSCSFAEKTRFFFLADTSPLLIVPVMQTFMYLSLLVRLSLWLFSR